HRHARRSHRDAGAARCRSQGGIARPVHGPRIRSRHLFGPWRAASPRPHHAGRARPLHQPHAQRGSDLRRRARRTARPGREDGRSRADLAPQAGPGRSLGRCRQGAGPARRGAGARDQGDGGRLSLRILAIDADRAVSQARFHRHRRRPLRADAPDHARRDAAWLLC
ncbi:hypothetical protein LTR94_032698, partial [Friedmanniomyces endolithicus]